MGMEDFFASLPRGKDDKPLLFGMGPLTYDFHDIDGLYYMLDRRLSGCMILMWAKPMNPDITGHVTLDGKEITGYVLTDPSMVVLTPAVKGLTPMAVNVVTVFAASPCYNVTTLQEKLQIPIIPWRIPCLFPKTFSKMAHMAESHFRSNIPDWLIGVFNESGGFGEAVFHEVLVRGCLEA